MTSDYLSLIGVIITTGSKSSLQKHLYNHFHPDIQIPVVQPIPTLQITQIPVEPSMSDILTEFKKIQTQVNKLRSYQTTSWQPTIEPQQTFTSAVTGSQLSVLENTPLLHSCIDHTGPTQRSFSSAIPAALQPELEGNFIPNLNFNLPNQYTPPHRKSSLLKKINNYE